MNTQAHLLLAAALLCKSSNDGPNASNAKLQTTTRIWPVNTAVLVGALVPDMSLFLMFALARIRGISDEVIWGELYYSPFWQNIGAITNSVPVYLILAVVGYALLSRYKGWMGGAIFVFGFAALLHCLTDLPLHVDDGHAHFWPLSMWIYESPVSYWNTNHYANYWRPVEFFIACICALIVWRKFISFWVRSVALFGLLFYPVMFAFWFYLMG